MWAFTEVTETLLRAAVVSMAMLSGCISANVSLIKPIKVVFSDEEILEKEAALRANRFSDKDLKGALFFEGMVERKDADPSGEIIYQFTTMNVLYTETNAGGANRDPVRIVSPSMQNGGVNLRVGEEYRVYAPQLPDGRYGVWRGLVIRGSQPGGK